MFFEPLAIPDVILCRPLPLSDHRGRFSELWKHTDFEKHGIGDVWVQENTAKSNRGVLRGLHYQRRPFAQSKLVRCTKGTILDVAVDIRPESLSFGQHVAVELNADNQWQLYIPAGFAHGYYAITQAEVCYKIGGSPYEKTAEGYIHFKDPILNIDWPSKNPTVSAKDAAGMLLGQAAKLGLLTF